MPVEERNLVEIAGGTFNYRVGVSKNGKIIPFLKIYAVDFYISRYEQRSSVIAVRGVFDPGARNFKVTVPAALTRSLSGNYLYRIKVTTPQGHEIIKNYGHLFVHQSIG